jgi:hypothetical protein
LGPSLKPYEFKTKTVQKQTTSGQRMSYKAYHCRRPCWSCRFGS